MTILAFTEINVSINRDAMIDFGEKCLVDMEKMLRENVKMA